jgi:RNA-directed DNA polymerase
LLDDLDKVLEKRGHRFCRYADDCNIYVQSERAGQRVMNLVTRFLERKLRLKVNESKSAVARPSTRKFLGQQVMGGRGNAYLGIHPKSLLRAKERVRQITSRSRGVKLAQVMEELRGFTHGWVAYHRYADCLALLGALDEWIQRRLRCFIWKQWKTWRNRAIQMMKYGASRRLAYGAACNQRAGPWLSSGTWAMQNALTSARLAQWGYSSLRWRYIALAST